MSEPTSVITWPIVRFTAGAPESAPDQLAVEEPLEIRLAGEPLGVTMRTPGHDAELAVGLLLAEGIIRSAKDLGRILHCGKPGEPGHGNRLEVTAAPGTTLDPDATARARRASLTTAACGVCGRLSIDDLLVRCQPVHDESRWPASIVTELPNALRRAQAAFAQTGGLHAAGIADAGGRLLVVREDVGRHNAVDKVIGRLVLDGALPRQGLGLVVSGRASFEIVQKAVVAGVAVVVSVSAPSSLAVETADRAGVTLLGFARGHTFNAYTHARRIGTPGPPGRAPPIRYRSPRMNLTDARPIVTAATALTARAVERAASITGQGARIDDHQALVSRVAYAATEARAAQELLAATVAMGDRSTPHLERLAIAGVAELATSARDRLLPFLDDLGLTEDDVASFYGTEVRRAMRLCGHESVLREIGRDVAAAKGKSDVPLEETLEQVRHSVRQFSDAEVAPQAEHLHRHDDLVPEAFIGKMAEVGYFGLSVPEEYGGYEMGNLAMIITTEELSRGSLAGAGSLITRPEILAKALLSGGTEAQKKHWLPKIATGELMVGISVTEPNIGSDVASLGCRAERRTVGGVEGWVLNGAKSWCTFAGRADILAVLARTDPDSSKGAKGLSLFIVPKEASRGHDFSCTQPGGGKMDGKADRTPGYRGMHSFTLALEDYFVPAENLVGEAGGEGRGFYLQMAGFAAGRLQTGGRACGVAQAAVEKTAEYVSERTQFKRPILEFQLTQYHLGRMATKLAAARAITYAAAQAMDEDERRAAPLAAQAKLFACDAAVDITQTGQLLHGGWGYAEEYAISRYVIDAQVLPIFEGVKPILELKVVARALLGGGQ